MHILGVSALYHDAAAVLVRDGEVVAAAQEERFSRLKQDASLPVQMPADACAEREGDVLEDPVVQPDRACAAERAIFRRE